MFWVKCLISLDHSFAYCSQDTKGEIDMKKVQRLLTLNRLFMFISHLCCVFKQWSPDVATDSFCSGGWCVPPQAGGSSSFGWFPCRKDQGHVLQYNWCKHKPRVGQAPLGPCGAYNIWIGHATSGFFSFQSGEFGSTGAFSATWLNLGWGGDIYAKNILPLAKATLAGTFKYGLLKLYLSYWAEI